MAHTSVTQAQNKFDDLDTIILAPTHGKTQDAATTPKHPLQHTWVLWYDRRTATSALNYENNLLEIGTITTVEDFWSYTHHIKRPSQIDHPANYHFFKKPIKPLWEHPINVNGGKWIINLRDEPNRVDEYWEKLMLAMIGESLDVNDEICGAVFARRRAGDKIALWNRTVTDQNVILELGRRLRRTLALPETVRISYQYHTDSVASGSSYTNEVRFQL